MGVMTTARLAYVASISMPIGTCMVRASSPPTVVMRPTADLLQCSKEPFTVQVHDHTMPRLGSRRIP